MTYELDTRLPFLIGTLSLVTMVWLAISLADPHIQQHRKISNRPLHALRAIGNMAKDCRFSSAGFMAAINSKSGEYTTLLFQSLGVAVTLFGAIQALEPARGRSWIHYPLVRPDECTHVLSIRPHCYLPADYHHGMVTRPSCGCGSFCCIACVLSYTAHCRAI